jgi:hypothetical protein
MKKIWTAWDFDSSLLAYQITLISKALLLQVRNTYKSHISKKKGGEKKEILDNVSQVNFGRKNKH